MPRPAAAIRTSSLRAAALLAIGALALHELRYLIDPSAGSTAWAGEHGYLSAAAPLLLVGALSLVVVTLLGPLVGLRRGRHSRRGDLTGSFALALLFVHLGQEAGEAIAAGTPLGGLAVSMLAAAAFAIPLALALGGLASFLAGRLERTERRVAAALHRRRVGVPAIASWGSPPLLGLSILGLAAPGGRGPPIGSTARS